MEYSFRPLRPSEYEATVRLWVTVFHGSPEYFERYYRADPWYCEGDSLGAWAGDILVSAVHLCRRPLHWDGGITSCGGIANVATLENHRRRGLSRRLLSMAIERMADTGVHFSMLGTGRPGHYAALGWQAVPFPAPVVTLASISQSPSATRTVLAPAAAGVTPEIERIYREAVLLPLRLERPTTYFTGWVGWNMGRSGAELMTLPGRGYLAFLSPPERGGQAVIGEWQAVDRDAEGVLLAEAAHRARILGAKSLRLAAVPTGGSSRLEALGNVELATRSGTMLRNVSMDESAYGEVIRLYQAGEAHWWPADGF